MKRLTILFLSVALVMVLSELGRAQVLWRSASCMKHGQAIAMAEWYYMDFTKKFINDAWKDNPNDQSRWGFETMFGYAPLDNWEVLLHVPVTFNAMKTNAMDESVSGIGDIYFKTSYGLIPWAKDKHGLTLIGSLRLPTGSDDEVDPFLNTGDGTTDIGLGGIFSTAWMGSHRGHVKLNYWINGKNDADKKIGNELQLILKYDYNFTKKFFGFAAYTYNGQAKSKDASGAAIAGSDKKRHVLCIGGTYKPKPGMFIRPKIALPLGGENGLNYEFKPMVDFWFTFKI